MEFKKESLKVGIAGIGHMGRYHIHLLSRLLPSSNIYIYDVNKQACDAVVQEYEVNFIESYEAMLELVDAVIIVVPTYLHYEFAMKALEKDRHVLVEKPIADNFDHAKEMLETAMAKGIVFHVGHVERFNGAVHEVRKILKDPQYITTQRIGSVSRIRDVGVVLDLMIHDIDLVLSLIDSPIKEINAHGHSVVTDFEDYALATLYFENGCIAQLIASRVSLYKDRRMNIAQADNYIQLDYASNELLLYRKINDQYDVSQGEIKYREEHMVDRTFVIKGNPLETELQYFIDSIVGSEHLAKKYKDFIWDENSNLYTMEIAFRILDEIKKKSIPSKDI